MIEVNNCCVMCGVIIPEGEQVCLQCRAEVFTPKSRISELKDFAKEILAKRNAP